MEEKTLYIDVSLNFNQHIHAIEYTYDDGDYPNHETLENHVIELLKAGAFGEIEDLVHVEVTNIDE